MRSVFLVLLPLLLTPPSWAALATDADAGEFFFRSKYSLFPSGQASRTSLESKLFRTETELSYRSAWDHKEYILQGNQIIRDIQVARFVETKSTTPLYSLNRSDSPAIKSLTTKTSLEIIAVEDFWARVKEKKGSAQGWVPLHTLQSCHDDLGVFTNLIDTYLRAGPSSNASVITTLPRLRRLIPLEIGKDFLKVQYENHIGFVDITHFISRADFANLAYHPQKNWVRVLYRNNDRLITSQAQAIPLKEVLGYVADGHRGIVKNSSGAYSPPLRARVEILKPEAHVWGISQLEGHGEVWWKRKNLLVEESKPVTSNQILTDTLMKREIYSIAFESKNSLRGLVSSNGIYRTEDGITWTQIPQFGKSNYPVSIHPNGTWFVGPYKSINKGQSFLPFIRWDNIAQAIESAYHRNPKILKLTQIEALPNSRIQILVDTGSDKVKLRSLIGDLRWDVIKN